MTTVTTSTFKCSIPHLIKKGRAGFVMANSVSDARGSEQEIRQNMIEGDAVDVMVEVSSNFFYTITLPCVLWLLDKNKSTIQQRQSVVYRRSSYLPLSHQ
ncbi:N-6 DNA methylase [Vibrio alginolyticus]